MSNKEKSFSLNLGASVLPSFTGSFDKASQEVNKLNSEYKKMQSEMTRNLNKQKQMDKGLEKEAQNEKKVRDELEKLNNTYKKNLSIYSNLNMKKIMNKELTSEERKELSRVNREIDGFNERSSKQKNRLNEVNERIQTQKDRIRILNNEYKKMETQQKKINELKDPAERKLRIEEGKNRTEAFKKKSKNIGDKAGEFSSKTFRAGTAVMTPLLGSAIAAAKNEYEFAGVRKQFEFKDKGEEEAFKEELLKIVTEKKLAISLPELYQAATTFGQAGLSKEETPKAIEMSTKMALAFDIDPGQAAKNMLELRNSFSLDWKELEKILDQINGMSNNAATDAATLTEFMQRAGETGGIAGFSKEQTMGIGTFLLESGVETSRAATALKKLSKGLMEGKGATDKQYYAWQKIGFNPEQLAKDMIKDSQKTLNKVMARLKKVRKDELPSIIDALFGDESIDSIVKIFNNMDRVNHNIKTANDEKITKGSMDREANTYNDTTLMKYKRLITELQISTDKVGQSLFPTFDKWSEDIKKVANAISELQKNDPEKFNETINNIKDLGIALIGISAASKGVQLLAKLAPIMRAISKSAFKTTGFTFFLDSTETGDDEKIKKDISDIGNKYSLIVKSEDLNKAHERDQKEEQKRMDLLNKSINPNITYSPQIIIQGNATNSDIEKILNDDKSRFKDTLDFMKENEKMMKERKRRGEGR